MECLKLQEEEAGLGKSELSCIVYKGHMKAHSKFLDKLTGLVEADHDDKDIEMSCKSGKNCTALMSQILNPDEQDMNEPDGIIRQQLEVTSNALRKVNRLMRKIEPFIHDV